MAGILAAIIAAFSPFWGLIFILSFCGKYLSRKNIFLAVFAIAAIALLAAGIIDLASFADIICGVGLAVFLYCFVFLKTASYLSALLAGYGMNIVYAVLRSFLLRDIMKTNLAQVIESYRQFLDSTLQNKPENLEMMLAILNSMEEIFSKYFIGIWIVSITFGLYFGTLLFSQKTGFKWQHNKIGMPFFFIYLLIIALLLFILPGMRTAGINALATLTPIFLIQGISILDFFWGDFFRKSRFLLYLLIVSMVFNYFILILVALVGLLDIWFDFRKIRTMEEIHESHSD